MGISKFYAVTTTSVYLITEERNEYDWPRAEKIALRDDSGVKLGGILKNGTHVGILSYAITLYNPKVSTGIEIESPDYLNIRLWGGTTTRIIALFTAKKEALKCLNAGSKETLDKRWKDQTEKTLRRIGTRHNTFIISHELADKFSL